MSEWISEVQKELIANRIVSMVHNYCQADDLRPSDALIEIFSEKTIRAIRESKPPTKE